MPGLLTAGIASAQDPLIERGEYLVYAGGCITCHTVDEEDAPHMAGGRAMETPFGTFYAPNITPDDETGIGLWSDEDFLNALRFGISPDGYVYYPSLPYPSYTGVTDEDLLAIKAYLFSIEPVKRPNRKHKLRWYVSTRIAARAWRRMNFEPGAFVENPDETPEWNRGAYLVRHLGHCGECHTPRKRSGKLIQDRALTGDPSGPDGEKVPGITQDREDGIGRWSISDIALFLEIGMLPDGDFAGGLMAGVIDDNTSHLTDVDRRAIAVYLKSIAGPENETAP